MQTVAQRLKLYLVDYLVDEGKLKQQLGFLLADATLTHIEEGCIIELTNSGTVRALYVVGIYLKHRLSVHTCLLGGAKVLVYFLAYCLLCTVTHKHSASKGTGRLIVKHIFI